MVGFTAKEFSLARSLFFILAVFFLCLDAELPAFPPGHHGFVSAHGLSLAKNISWTNKLIPYARASIDAEEKTSYLTYVRFPLTTFILMKAAMLPVAPQLSLEINVARKLMLLFYLLAMYGAFLSMSRLMSNPLLALAATALAFAGFTPLYYADMTFNDSPALCGLFLLFHGLVCWLQEGRRGQLFLKLFSALMLGWQPFALLASFTVVHSIACLWLPAQRRQLAFLAALWGFAIVLASGILAGQLYGEHLLTAQPILASEALSSAANRFGMNAALNQGFKSYFELSYIYNLYLALLSDVFSPSRILAYLPPPNLWVGFVLGLAMLGSCLSRQRILLLSLFFSLFFWIFPLLHFVVFHGFQFIYATASALVFWAVFLQIPQGFAQLVRRYFPRTASLLRVFALPSAGLLALGCCSVLLAAQIDVTKHKQAEHAAYISQTAEMQRVRDQLPAAAVIYIDDQLREQLGSQALFAADFYLGGFVQTVVRKEADFIVSNNLQGYQNNLLNGNVQLGLFLNLERASKRMPSRELALRFGEGFIATHDYQRALEYLEYAKGENLASFALYRSLATAYAGCGDWQKAFNFTKQAAELDRQNTYFSLLDIAGPFWSRADFTRAAISFYQQIKLLYPEDTFADINITTLNNRLK